MRGIPFFAGILGGIIVEEMKTRKIKFTPVSRMNANSQNVISGSECWALKNKEKYQ